MAFCQKSFFIQRRVRGPLAGARLDFSASNLMFACRSECSHGLVRGRADDLPLDCAAAAEVSEDYEAAASTHHGLHPSSPRHHYHVRYGAEGLPREIPRYQVQGIERWCCYKTVDFAMAASQNGVCLLNSRRVS